MLLTLTFSLHFRPLDRFKKIKFSLKKKKIVYCLRNVSPDPIGILIISFCNCSDHHAHLRLPAALPRARGRRPRRAADAAGRVRAAEAARDQQPLAAGAHHGRARPAHRGAVGRERGRPPQRPAPQEVPQSDQPQIHLSLVCH